MLGPYALMYEPHAFSNTRPYASHLAVSMHCDHTYHYFSSPRVSGFQRVWRQKALTTGVRDSNVVVIHIRTEHTTSADAHESLVPSYPQSEHSLTRAAREGGNFTDDMPESQAAASASAAGLTSSTFSADAEQT